MKLISLYIYFTLITISIFIIWSLTDGTRAGREKRRFSAIAFLRQLTIWQGKSIAGIDGFAFSVSLKARLESCLSLLLSCFFRGSALYDRVTTGASLDLFLSYAFFFSASTGFVFALQAQRTAERQPSIGPALAEYRLVGSNPL